MTITSADSYSVFRLKFGINGHSETQSTSGEMQSTENKDVDNNYAEQLLDEVLSQNSGLSSSFRSSLSSQTDLRMKEEEERDKTPPWIRWSHSLEELLDDSAGFELFRKYLEDNDVVDVLWFYFAVKGMRKQTMANMEMQKRQKLLLSIYTRFVQSIALQLLPQTRQSLDRYFSSGQPDKSDFHIFDEAQQEVLQLMRNNLHQNFLNSDLYIDFVNQQAENQNAEQNDSSGESLAEVPNDAPDSGVTVATPLTPVTHNTLPSLATHRSTFQPFPQGSFRPQPPPPLLSPWPKTQSVNPIASHMLQPGPSSSFGSLSRPPPPVPTKPTNFIPSFNAPSSLTQHNPLTLTREALIASTAARKAENEKKTVEIGSVNAYYSKYAAYQPVSARESEVQSHLTDNTRRRMNDPSHPEKNDVARWEDVSKQAQKNREQSDDFLLLQPKTRNDTMHEVLNLKEFDPRKERTNPEVFAKVLSEKLSSLTTTDPNDRSAHLMQHRQSSEEPVDDSEKALIDAVARIKDETPDSNTSLCVTPQPGLDLAGRSHIRNIPTVSASGSSMGNVTSFPVAGHFRPPVYNLSQPFTGVGLRTNGPSLENPGNKAYQSHPFGQQNRPVNSSSGYGTNQSSYFSSNDDARMQHRAQPAQLPPQQQRHHEANHQDHDTQQRHRTLSNSQRQSSRHSGSTSSRNVPPAEVSRRSKAHIGSAAPTNDRATTVLYRRGQAGEFFMSKLIGDTTLKNFKKQILPENLKKLPDGSLKFYFKREEPDLGVVWDDISDDHARLPLYDGRITATVET